MAVLPYALGPWVGPPAPCVASRGRSMTTAGVPGARSSSNGGRRRPCRWSGRRKSPNPLDTTATRAYSLSMGSTVEERQTVTTTIYTEAHLRDHERLDEALKAWRAAGGRHGHTFHTRTARTERRTLGLRINAHLGVMHKRADLINPAKAPTFKDLLTAHEGLH